MNLASRIFRRVQTIVLVAGMLGLVAEGAFAAPPSPLLTSVFPAGCQVGTTVDLTLTGTALDGLRSVECNAPRVHSEVVDGGRVRLSVPADTLPGCYDLWAVGSNGVSSPRSFIISSRPEFSEAEPNNSLMEAQSVPLDSIFNGRIDSASDLDAYRFQAQAGQRVILECVAQRMDSSLRAVLTILNNHGRELAVGRGYFGVDPLISFDVPEEGSYVVQVAPLTPTSAANQAYRLEIDTHPRVVFARPDVLQQGTTTQVELFGWNLNPQQSSASTGPSSGFAGFDRIVVDVTAPIDSEENRGSMQIAFNSSLPRPMQRHAAEAVIDSFPFYLQRSQAAIFLGLTDLPVWTDVDDNHAPSTAEPLDHPCLVAGQLTGRTEQDWYAIQARRGEVFYLEAFGQRIQSPVDLEISVFDATGQKELVQFGDQSSSVGGRMLDTSHSDPVGRWVAPEDGRFLLNVRNIGGGVSRDERRIYRLSVRREDADLHLLAMPANDSAGRLNLRRGGREVVNVFALRHRGLNESIRISARNLPAGVECPDVWLGPAVTNAVIVVSADQGAAESLSELQLVGSVEGIDRLQNIPLQFGTSVPSGTPLTRSRLISRLPLAVTGEAPIRIIADGHEALQHPLYGTIQVQHSPGGVLDVAVQIDRRDAGHGAPVRLTGVGLPQAIVNETSVIPAGQAKGYLSFRLPATLLPGQYSVAVQAETTIAAPDQKTESVVVVSNPVTFEIQPAAFAVEVDPFAQKRVRRGETIQVSYTSRRQNGFIGKMHTELAIAGIITDIPGILGRGETFTGQTEQGSLQILVNEDAVPGPQPFLRLFTVGVVEDQPVFFGSALLPLEVME